MNMCSDKNTKKIQFFYAKPQFLYQNFRFDIDLGSILHRLELLESK